MDMASSSDRVEDNVVTTGANDVRIASTGKDVGKFDEGASNEEVGEFEFETPAPIDTGTNGGEVEPSDGAPDCDVRGGDRVD